MYTHHDNTHLRGRRAAFTLVELMISIALVLLLMLGINQVFKVTGEAVGTNQAISTGLRDARAIQAVLTSDFNAWATDVPLANSPPVIIRSERVSAFRNKADEQQDRDWDPVARNDIAKLTVDIDGNGLEGEPGVAGEQIPPAIYNFRSHRVDRMMFFGRGLFRRQTGGAIPAAGVYADEYVADMSTSEAWIWYGHLKRPDERGTPTNNNSQFPHRDPGDNPNPSAQEFNDRNFHASDFVLGRMAMLCASGKDLTTPPDGVDDEVVDRRGNPQHFIRRTAPMIPPPTMPQDTTLSPLIQNVQSNEQNTSDRWAIQWSRYDIVNTTTSQFKAILTNWLEVNGTVPPTSQMAWYRQMGDWRFQGDPQPLRPFTTHNTARLTPVFLEHCSQFIVEFAGDFLNQDINTGALDSANPYQSDGITDFLIDASTGTPTRRIRWYGMPRDIAGSSTGGPDGIIRGGGGPADPNQLVDVVPLRDVLGSTFTYAPTMVGAITTEFAERHLPWPGATPPADYALSMLPDATYVVAWGPDTADQPRPKMIRIVVTIDDPEGRIAEGQTFEYVFRVGG